MEIPIGRKSAKLEISGKAMLSWIPVDVVREDKSAFSRGAQIFRPNTCSKDILWHDRLQTKKAHLS